MRRWGVILLFLLILTFLFSGSLAAEEILVHFIDVGQGDAILIQGPEGNVLIDGGDRWDWVGERLISYLEAQGVEKLEAIVSTHPHADHIGGLPAVINNFPVEKIYDSGRIHTTRTFEEYLLLIDRKGIPYATPRRGEVLTVANLEFKVLHPGPNIEDYSLNDASIVLRLEFGEISFLFTGDAEKRAEREIIESGLPVSATILKVGHHGSRTSTNPFFLEEVGPEVAVIQVGEDNRFGHPRAEVLQLLEKHEIEVYRNDQAGTVVIGSDGSDYWVETEQEVEEKQPAEIAKININTATEDELQKLHGIGPVLAERIIEYREKHGPFNNIQELENVQGIGPATLDNIKDDITLK